MDAGVANVFQIVEYSRDKWTMERVPRALLFCLVGMAFVVYVDPRPPGPGILKAFILLVGFLVIATLTLFVFEQIFEGGTAAIRLLAAGLVTLVLMALFWNAPGELLRFPPRRTRVGPNILGWMLVIGALGWITFALYRHFNPARPILMLSRAGISYHASLLKNLLIPWHEVRGVDAFERTGASGIPDRYPDLTAVLVSREFYDQHILVKRSVFGGPKRSWDTMFVPKGSLMQMVLHYELFSVDPKHIREPVEARWKSFRIEQPSSLSDAKPIPEARQVYGAWSIDGSPWQAIKFLVPLIGIIGVLAVSTGVWPR